MGYLSHATGRDSKNPLRRSQEPGGLAGSSRGISIAAAANHRYPRRYGAGFGGAAETAGRNLSFALRSAQSVSGERRGRTPSVGDGVPPSSIFRPRWARGSRSSVAAAVRRREQSAHPYSFQRKDQPLARVLHVHI